MNEKDKTAAEETAKNTILNIIDELKNSKNKLETFKELVNKYSEDEATKDNDGNFIINKDPEITRFIENTVYRYEVALNEIIVYDNQYNLIIWLEVL